MRHSWRKWFRKAKGFKPSERLNEPQWLIDLWKEENSVFVERNGHNIADPMQTFDPESNLVYRAYIDKISKSFTPPFSAIVDRKVKYKPYLGTGDLLRAQGFTCALCRLPINFEEAELDHDGHTGWVRGVLCPSCNSFVRDLERDRGLLVSNDLESIHSVTLEKYLFGYLWYKVPVHNEHYDMKTRIKCRILRAKMPARKPVARRVSLLQRSRAASSHR